MNKEIENIINTMKKRGWYEHYRTVSTTDITICFRYKDLNKTKMLIDVKYNVNTNESECRIYSFIPKGCITVSTDWFSQWEDINRFNYECKCMLEIKENKI